MIIHGGVNQDFVGLLNDIAVLDTTTFTWSVIKAEGTIPPARYSHTATMVGTNMLIAFGMYSFKKIVFSRMCSHTIFTFLNNI